MNGDDRRAALALVPVSRETEERLAVYVDMLGRWQNVKNLVGASTLNEIWTRHIADSAQLVGIEPSARHWVDLGTGAGFPGLVIAILLRDHADASVSLIESNMRKCAFLRDVIRATHAPARVHMGRIEDIVPVLSHAVDVVTARALAPLPTLIAMSRDLLARGAVGLFLEGDKTSDADQGLKENGISLQFDCLPSRTRRGSRIIRVSSNDLPGLSEEGPA